MTAFIRAASCWKSPAKAALALAILASQLPVQAAAPPQPGPPASGDAGPVIVSPDPVKPPPKHRTLKRAPVKPQTYPSKPQQAVRTLR